MDGWSAKAWRAVVAAACLAAAVVCTWPLALHFASAVPLGTETAATIPLFDIWTLWWSADRFLHGYVNLWNAPIFHPAQGTFSFSEPMLLPGALLSPLFALRWPPALAHNVVLIATLWLNGIFCSRLVRGLGAARIPALSAGILMIALPFFAKVQGELPVLMLGGALASLDGLVRFGKDGSSRNAAIAGAGIVVQALTGLQLTLFSVLFVGGAGLVALAERRFARASALRLGAVAVVTALLLYGIVREPLRIHAEFGFHRDVELAQSLSAKAADFFSRPQGAIVPLPPAEDVTEYTEGLFPGFLVLALAVYGATRWPLDAARSRWRWYLLGSCVAAYLLALGLNASVLGWAPFATLRIMPGFREIRSVFRCAVFLQLHLVVLAAIGLSALLQRFRGSPRAPAVILAIGLLAALENLSAPSRLLPIPASPRTDWTAYVASQPPGTVLAHVPFPNGGDVEELAAETWRMFAQLDHHQPLVNGYSSNFPPLHREFMFAMGAQFPHPMLACALRRVFATDLLVVDQEWLSAHGPAFAQLSTLLQPAYSDSAVAIYRLQPSETECPPMRIDIGKPPP